MVSFQLDQLNIALLTLASPSSFHIHPFRYSVIDDFGHPYDILLCLQVITNIYHLAFDQEVLNIPQILILDLNDHLAQGSLHHPVISIDLFGMT